MTRVRAKANGIRIAAWALAAVVGTACPDSFAAGAEPGSSEAKVLDDFESLKPWTTFASDQVSASLRQVDGPSGKAMCLAYDFHGVCGYAVARRKLPLDYPGNFEFSLKLRGEAPANQLEFKLPDASGDNVWWATRRDYVPPQDWTPLRIKRRHVSFAWGPSEDRTLRRTESFEITIAAGRRSATSDPRQRRPRRRHARHRWRRRHGLGAHPRRDHARPRPPARVRWRHPRLGGRS